MNQHVGQTGLSRSTSSTYTAEDDKGAAQTHDFLCEDCLSSHDVDVKSINHASGQNMYNVPDHDVDHQITRFGSMRRSHSKRPAVTRQHTKHLSEEVSSEDTIDEEKAKPAPLAAVGFWHAGLAETRKEVLFKYMQTLLILCLSIMAILSIYWGVLFDVKEGLHHATVAVVSFEGTPGPYESVEPIVGPFVWRQCQREMDARPDHLGFESVDPAVFNNDPIQVRLAVFEEKYWAAIIINANATALLQEAVAIGNASYDPQGVATMVYNQARDIESYNFYIVPVLGRLALQIQATFGPQWALQVFNNASLDVATYSQAPQAVSPGISFTLLNLRPFDPPSAIPTITIGLIYLIIIAFFSFTFFIPTHMKFILPNPMSPHPPLKFYQLIIYRWLATITAYFFLSLSYSLVSLAFQIPFGNGAPPLPSPLNDGHGHWIPTEPIINANYLGNATFVVYWILNFIGMAALGLTCENMAMLLSALSPLPYSALFLIWWVITNVSTGFYAIELASDFYKWGYAWPLRHIVEGSKTLVFGTKSRLGLNFGVLLAWVVLGTLLFPVACWVMRWKNIKDRRRAAELAKKLEEMKKA